MTTVTYTTTSDAVRVTDADAVESLLSEYSFKVEPTLENEYISFYSDGRSNAAFEVYETTDQRNLVTLSFLERLSEYLNESFELRWVEVEGDAMTDVWEWTFSKNGNVSKIKV